MGIIRKIINHEKAVIDHLEEINYSNVWHDTIKGIEWAEGLSGVSPGRAAVGYNYLYVMTRILNELRPDCVLDIGLGISSTLISQYFANCYEKGQAADSCDVGGHYILEHSEEWIDFYKKEHFLSKYSTIIMHQLVVKTIDGNKFYAYENLEEDVSKHKYDVISIDAPYGFGFQNKNGNQKYSRRDMIELLPQILKSEFVIVLDDVNRVGEKNTANDIIRKLEMEGIKVYNRVYRGQNYCCVIASERYMYMTSL